MIKRIITILAVTALMAVMLAAMAVPAFAKGKPPCKGNAHLVQVNQGDLGDDNMNGQVCQINNKDLTFVDDRG